MKKLLFVLPLFAAFAAAMLAPGDVTGRWSGAVIVEDKGSGSEVSTPVEFQLQQQGNSITGKVGRKDDPDASPVQNGKIEGNRITLDVVSKEIMGPAKFALTVVNDTEMQGDMTVKVEEGTFNGKVKLKREK